MHKKCKAFLQAYLTMYLRTYGKLLISIAHIYNALVPLALKKWLNLLGTNNI